MPCKLRAAKNPHQSGSPKAKNQQKCKCKQGLFAKAYEYSMYCDADVYVVLWSQDNGHIFSFMSDDGWSPSMRELVCPHCCLQKPEILTKEGTPLSSVVEVELKQLHWINYELSCFWSTKTLSKNAENWIDGWEDLAMVKAYPLQ